MQSSQVIQGRTITVDDVVYIRRLIEDHPEWHRTRISQQLCSHWDWTNDNGTLKDMAARALLRKLDDRGLIALPAAVRSANNDYRYRRQDGIALDQTPIVDCLGELRPLRIVPVANQYHASLFRGMLQEHHYLGYAGSVGENFKYLIFDRHDRLLAALLFGAAAWQVAGRDQWIGWTRAACRQGLSRVANNMRFLIVPWVQVPHLASHLLAQVSRRLCADWQQKYGHPIWLLETFVEATRFQGTCYRAANWIPVGHTTGRSRNDRHTKLSVPLKTVWLRPLHKHCQRLLSQADHHLHQPSTTARMP